MWIWLTCRSYESDSEVRDKELAALRTALEAEGHALFGVDGGPPCGPPRDGPFEATATKVHETALSCDLVLCVDWGDGPVERRFRQGGAFVGTGRPTVLAVPCGVRISEQERTLFECNPANLRDKVPGVVWFDQCSDVAAALRSTTLDMDLKIAL